MKKTKRPTEQELLHQWLEGDLDLTQQLYVEKDEPQPEAVEPYQPKRDRDTFLRSLRRSLRLYNVLAFLLCAVFAALMLMTVANLPRYGSADAPTVNEVAQRYVEQGTEETGAVNTVAGMILDYRAFDTLGESFVLFTAVCAVTILMNLSPKKRRPLPKEVVNYAADPIVAGVCRGLIPVILLFGVYILLNGHLSPGGGFSGGAVLAAALMIPPPAPSVPPFSGRWWCALWAFTVWPRATPSSPVPTICTPSSLPARRGTSSPVA